MEIKSTGEPCCRKEMVNQRYETPYNRCSTPATQVLNGRHYCEKHARIYVKECRRRFLQKGTNQ